MLASRNGRNQRSSYILTTIQM